MRPIERTRTRRAAVTTHTVPDLYLPAMPPLGLIARIHRAIDRRACRRQLQALLREEDNRLTDLGLSRSRIRHALRAADDPCHCLADNMTREMPRTLEQ